MSEITNRPLAKHLERTKLAYGALGQLPNRRVGLHETYLETFEGNQPSK